MVYSKPYIAHTLFNDFKGDFDNSLDNNWYDWRSSLDFEGSDTLEDYILQSDDEEPIHIPRVVTRDADDLNSKNKARNLIHENKNNISIQGIKVRKIQNYAKFDDLKKAVMENQQQPNSVPSNRYSNNQFEMNTDPNNIQISDGSSYSYSIPNEENYDQNLDPYNQRISYPYVDAHGQIIDGPNSQPLNNQGNYGNNNQGNYGMNNQGNYGQSNQETGENGNYGSPRKKYFDYNKYVRNEGNSGLLENLFYFPGMN